MMLQWKSFGQYALLMCGILLCLLMLTSCKDSPSSGHATGDTGALSFSVVYHGDCAAEALPPQATSFNCSDEGVKSIEANVYDESNSLLQSGGPWDCEGDGATISGVAAGTNRRVVVLGTNADGKIVFRGESSYFNVVANQSNDAGTIPCYKFYPTLQSPGDGTDVVDGFSLSWAEEGKFTYRVLVSENSDMNYPLIDGTTTATSYPSAGLTTRTTYHWQVIARDAYGNEGISPVRQFNLIKSWHNPSGPDDNISKDNQGADSPQVAMDSSGNAIVVWQQSDGTNMQIFKSEYR